MKILAVSTSSSNASVCLLEDDKLIKELNICDTKTHSEKLMPLIQELFEETGFSLSDVGLIACDIGPGSFTGIRIGLTVCKMLAWSLDKGIIPISSLEFMATTNVKTKYVIPFIDARHDKVFGGVYDTNLNIVIADAYTSINDLKDKLDDSYTFVSYDNFDLSNLIKPEYDVMRIINKHQNDNEISCHAIKPNYLKRTEAEESRL